jgi:hypothetical protein
MEEEGESTNTLVKLILLLLAAIVIGAIVIGLVYKIWGGL